MFILAAGRSDPEWSGEIGRESFDTLEAAEARMRDWARFGVDSYSTMPHLLWITDEAGQILKVWDWSTWTAVPHVAPEADVD